MEVTGDSNTTNFQDDSQVIISDQHRATISKPIGVEPFDQTSIANFLAKPFIFRNDEWKATDPVHELLIGFGIGPLLTNVLPWSEKCRGYRLFRGTCVVRVQINANPFQQGMLWLHYLPCEPNNNATFAKIHNHDRIQISQHPSAMLDCRDSSAILRIPYITPYNWFDRQTGYGDWGTFYLHVFSQLGVGPAGDTDLDYTVWVHFEDFECSAPIYPESATAVSRTVSNERVNMNKSNTTPSVFAGKASQLLGALTSVPFIGGAASLGSKAAGFAQGALQLVGLSKPRSAIATTFVSQNGNRFQFNSDSVEQADSITVNSMAQLDPLSKFAGLEQDEMSFNYLKTQVSFYTSVFWNVNSLPGTIIYQTEVSPLLFAQTTTQTVGSVFFYNTYPPFSYLSEFFRYYRGSIKIKLQFVKTDFHSGRIVISYSPNSASPTLVQSQYVLREIVDIRESSSVEFQLPYMANTNFLSTGASGIESSESIGVFTVTVLNELRAPETVAGGVNMLFFVSAGDDFELAQPVSTPYLSYQPESASLPIMYPEGSGPVDGTSTDLVSRPIGNSDIPPATPYASCTSIGEVFTSIKHLLLCLRPITLRTYVANSNIGSFYPYVTLVARASTPLIPPQLSGDYLHYFLNGYAFSRGGIHLSNTSLYDGMSIQGISVHPPLTFPIVSDTASSQVTFKSNSATNFIGDLPRFLPMRTLKNGQSCRLDVVVPHYGKTPMRINRTHTGASDQIAADPDEPRTWFDYESLTTPPTSATVTWHRAVADDFSLGFFIGFPPLLIRIDPDT